MSLEQDFREELTRLQPLLDRARAELVSVSTIEQVEQVLVCLHDYTESISIKDARGKTNLYRHLRHGLKFLAIELGAHLPKDNEKVDFNALIQAFDDQVLEIIDISAFMLATSGYELSSN